MTDQERYEQFDLPFYREHIAPMLPPRVLDFHAHAWETDQWITVPWETDAAGGKYMVTMEQYSLGDLVEDGRRMFPDRAYEAVCFGIPSPAGDQTRIKEYFAGASAYPGLFPLLVTGRDLVPRETIEATIREGGFFGYKVFLNWYGDDYGAVRIEDMLGPAEMELADALKLIVLWHVPRSRRLADPEIQRGIRDYAQRYPNARLVLAHCGRCYLPDEMQEAIGAIIDLPNVYLDTAMVMDPTVLQIAIERLGPSRILFATDLPVAAMRGRRVYVTDHWVDLVLEGNSPSAYRVLSNNMRATFMVYEIILAIRRAAERVGLTAEEQAAIYYGNGMALLNGVMDGEQMKKVAK